MTEFDEVRALADVLHAALRVKPFVLRLARESVMFALEFVNRHALQKFLESRREVFVKFVGRSHADNQPVAIDQAIAHVVKVVDEFIEVRVEVGEQIFQELVVRNVTGGVEGSGLRAIGSELRGHERRCHALQVEFKADNVLLNQFADSFLVRENRFVENFGEDVSHLGELGLESLNENPHARRERVRLIFFCVGAQGRSEAADVQVSENRQLLVGMFLRVDVAQQTRQQVRVENFFLRNFQRVEVKRQINYPVRVDVAEQNFRAVEVAELQREMFCLFAQVFAFQNRNRLQSFGRVGRLLAEL